MQDQYIDPPSKILLFGRQALNKLKLNIQIDSDEPQKDQSPDQVAELLRQKRNAKVVKLAYRFTEMEAYLQEYPNPIFIAQKKHREESAALVEKTVDALANASMSTLSITVDDDISMRHLFQESSFKKLVAINGLKHLFIRIKLSTTYLGGLPSVTQAGVQAAVRVGFPSCFEHLGAQNDKKITLDFTDFPTEWFFDAAYQKNLEDFKQFAKRAGVVLVGLERPANVSAAASSATPPAPVALVSPLSLIPVGGALVQATAAPSAAGRPLASSPPSQAPMAPVQAAASLAASSAPVASVTSPSSDPAAADTPSALSETKASSQEPLLDRSANVTKRPFWKNWKFWLSIGIAVAAAVAFAATVLVTGGIGAIALGALIATGGLAVAAATATAVGAHVGVVASAGSIVSGATASSALPAAASAVPSAGVSASLVPVASTGSIMSAMPTVGGSASLATSAVTAAAAPVTSAVTTDQLLVAASAVVAVPVLATTAAATLAKEKTGDPMPQEEESFPRP